MNRIDRHVVFWIKNSTTLCPTLCLLSAYFVTNSDVQKCGLFGIMQYNPYLRLNFLNSRVQVAEHDGEIRFSTRKCYTDMRGEEFFCVSTKHSAVAGIEIKRQIAYMTSCL